MPIPLARSLLPIEDNIANAVKITESITPMIISENPVSREETIPMKCADNEGGLCTIFIVTKKNEENRKQFYINYDDVKIVYNVYVSK